MSKPFVSTDPPGRQGENTWFTPKEMIDALGPFDLDPCTVSFRPFNTAFKHVEHDKGGCGLMAKWAGDVWLNPPYGKELTPFIDKFMSHRKGAMLIFSRMGNGDVQRLIADRAYIFCLRKRVKFIAKDGTKASNAGTDSIIVFYDRKFIKRVEKLGGILLQLPIKYRMQR